jgi:hypothetical protein
MAIRDLLWACPVCGTFASIRAAGRGTERCDHCGTTYRRGRGASIEVREPGTKAQAHHPATLVDRLRPVSEMPLPEGRLGPAPALIRVQRTIKTVRDGEDFLGRIEVFGPAVSATVTLDQRTLAAGIPERPIVWPLETITAVQPSSSTLQINSRAHPLVSFQFIDHSVRLWEEALQARLRSVHRDAGNGRIVQFHPHVRFG